MKEEFDRKPGLNPASWKYGVGWMDGTPVQQNPHQIFMVNGNYGWHIDGTGNAPRAARPEDAEIVAARHVAQPSRVSQSGNDAGRQPQSGLAVGTG